jgi:hypothetical protein
MTTPLERTATDADVYCTSAHQISSDMTWAVGKGIPCMMNKGVRAESTDDRYSTLVHKTFARLRAPARRHNLRAMRHQPPHPRPAHLQCYCTPWPRFPSGCRRRRRPLFIERDPRDINTSPLTRRGVCAPGPWIGRIAHRKKKKIPVASIPRRAPCDHQLHRVILLRMSLETCRFDGCI